METLPSIEECELAFSSMDNIIGEGRDRVGFHIPGSRWVYKLEKHPFELINSGEFERYNKFKNLTGSKGLPAGIYFPEMHLLANGAIAAEFIEGNKPRRCDWRVHEKHSSDYSACWLNAVEAFSDITGLWDSGALCNIRVVEKDGETKVYIIDLGE